METELDNPCGLNGFAFLEFSGNKQLFNDLFTKLGFKRTFRHQALDIALFEQGGVKFLVSATSNSQASLHASTHGPGACAMGFRVHDVEIAHREAILRGAEPFHETGSSGYALPAIKAIGGSVIYFVDDKHQPNNQQWQAEMGDNTPDAGLKFIDHITHNVHKGNMDKWAQFYKNIFNFRQIRYFDIEGQMTGLISRALSSPCNKIKIPLNESKDDKSQIEEFLTDYHGEGIQHVALSTDDIYATVPDLRQRGVKFLDVPATYYEMLNDRISWHQEPLATLAKEKILIDGETSPALGLLLQIFTENLFGPVFFEVIQRKGNQGFGEGNFKALFEAIERDQIRRGTL